MYYTNKIMNICKVCGSELDANTKFCPVCGEKHVEEFANAEAGNYQQMPQNYGADTQPNVMTEQPPYVQQEYTEVAAEPVVPEKKRKLNKKLIAIISASVVLVALICVFVFMVLMPSLDYKEANELADKGKYSEAIKIYEELGDYKDSENKIKFCNYEMASDLVEDEKYGEAAKIYKKLGNYKDSKSQLKLCSYEEANALVEEEKYEEAANIYEDLEDYEDSSEKLVLCNYGIADSLLEDGEYEKAATMFEELGDYEDSSSKFIECNRNILVEFARGYESGIYKTQVSDVDFFIALVNDGEGVMMGFQSEGDSTIIFGAAVNMSGDSGAFSCKSDDTEMCGGTFEISEINGYSDNSDAINITRIMNDNWSFYYDALDIADSCMSILSNGMTSLLEQTELGITPEDLGFFGV